jgi:hypothetical protein
VPDVLGKGLGNMFSAAADTFRDRLTFVAQNRKTIGALLN